MLFPGLILRGSTFHLEASDPLSKESRSKSSPQPRASTVTVFSSSITRVLLPSAAPCSCQAQCPQECFSPSSVPSWCCQDSPQEFETCLRFSLKGRKQNYKCTHTHTHTHTHTALVVKNLPANTGDIRDRKHKRHGFVPWVRKITWRRAWQPTPVFLPGESHGQRSLAGYCPWGRKESNTIEAT